MLMPRSLWDDQCPQLPLLRGSTRCSDPKRMQEVSVMTRKTHPPCELARASCLVHVFFAVLTQHRYLRHWSKTQGLMASHLDVLDIQPQPQLLTKDLYLCWGVIPNAHLSALTQSAEEQHKTKHAVNVTLSNLRSSLSQGISSNHSSVEKPSDKRAWGVHRIPCRQVCTS